MLSVDALEPARRDAGGAVRLRQAVPNGFVFSPDGRYSLRQLVLHRRLEHLPLRARDRQARGGEQHRDRLLPPDPARRRRADRLPLHGPGFVPARITARPLEDVSAITFLGERLVEEHPVVETWNVGSPAKIPFDTMAKTTGVYRLGGGLRRESLYPIVQGYKDTAAVGVRLNLSDPLSLNALSLTGVVFARRVAARQRARAPRRGVPALRLAGDGRVQRRRFLRSVRPDQARPARATSRRSAIETC